MTEAAELRSAPEVTAWLAAGLGLRRVAAVAPGTPAGAPADAGDAARTEAAIRDAIVACASELGALPPAGVIADVALLLGGARLGEPVAIRGDDALAAAIRGYEDDVLARLVATPRFDDVLAAYAHLPPARRASAVALVVGALCERASFAGVAVSPASLRRALVRPRDERDARGRAELRGGAMVARLADAYARLARGARHCRALVDDREVFAIDHLEVLGSFGRRLAAAHLADAAAAFAARLPRRLPARRDRRGDRATALADDTLYPAGGFTAITPRAGGNVESLVTSELAYIEDGDDPVDLFTLRYLEGELLHYTRDDSVFRRRRHAIVFALAGDLDDARVKDPELPWQRLVVALGLVVAVTRWVVDRLGDEALAIDVAFPPHGLAAERELVALLLAGEREAGVVRVVEQPWEVAIAGAPADADRIVLSLGAAPALAPGVRALHVGLAGAAPALRALGPPAAAPAAPADPDPDAWTAWCDAAEDLLRWLV